MASLTRDLAPAPSWSTVLKADVERAKATFIADNSEYNHGVLNGLIRAFNLLFPGRPLAAEPAPVVAATDAVLAGLGLDAKDRIFPG